MADKDTAWALENFREKLEKITNLKKNLNESRSRCRPRSFGRSSNQPQSTRFHSSERSGSQKNFPTANTAYREREIGNRRQGPENRQLSRQNDIAEREVEMKTICECLNEFEKCVLQKSKLIRDRIPQPIPRSISRPLRDESTNTDSVNSANEPRPGTSIDRVMERRYDSNDLHNELLQSDAEPESNIRNDGARLANNSALDEKADESNAESNNRPSLNEPSSLNDTDQSEIPESYRPIGLSNKLRLFETDNGSSSSDNIPVTESPSSLKSSTTSLASIETKEDLESLLRNSSPGAFNDDRMPSSPVGFPIVPCHDNLVAENELNKRILEQKLNRMYEMKKAYYSDPADDIPFIDLSKIKYQVFTDEPIESAYVYGKTVPQTGGKSSSAQRRLDSRNYDTQLKPTFSPIQFDAVTNMHFPFSNQK